MDLLQFRYASKIRLYETPKFSKANNERDVHSPFYGVGSRMLVQDLAFDVLALGIFVSSHPLNASHPFIHDHVLILLVRCIVPFITFFQHATPSKQFGQGLGHQKTVSRDVLRTSRVCIPMIFESNSISSQGQAPRLRLSFSVKGVLQISRKPVDKTYDVLIIPLGRIKYVHKQDIILFYRIP